MTDPTPTEFSWTSNAYSVAGNVGGEFEAGGAIGSGVGVTSALPLPPPQETNNKKRAGVICLYNIEVGLNYLGKGATPFDLAVVSPAASLQRNPCHTTRVALLSK